jgi:hypothetical protein
MSEVAAAGSKCSGRALDEVLRAANGGAVVLGALRRLYLRVNLCLS